MRICVLDTETTGLDPAQGAALLEVAWVALDDESGDWEYGAHDSHFIRYDGTIPPEARAVHHIRECDVDALSDATPRDALIHSMLCAEVPGEMLYTFHNKKFDLQFLPELRLPSICTWRCAQHLWPDAPSHSNQVLRYWLGTEPPEELLTSHVEDSGYGSGGVPIPLAPHRAAYDAAVTAAVLLRMLQERTTDELVRLSDAPVLLRKIRFGKHKGQLWSEVPKSYLRWLLDKSDVCRDDSDVAHTARHYLGEAS